MNPMNPSVTETYLKRSSIISRDLISPCGLFWPNLFFNYIFDKNDMRICQIFDEKPIKMQEN